MGVSSAQNYEEHKDDLSGGGELGVDAGWKRPVPGDQQNHDRDNEDQHVPAEHKDGEPPGELLFEREDDEGRREQKFVGDGIEISAKSRSLIQTALEQTINPIGKASDHNKHKPPPLLIVLD